MALNGGNKGLKLENATLIDATEIAEIAVSASTSPRILLEFQNCKREDFLDWYIQATKAAINASLECPEEALALKVVDEESGRIAGYAVWGWSSRATDLVFKKKVELPLPAGTNKVLRNKFVNALVDLEKTYQLPGDYFELLDLMTAPAFRRRGIGSQLVQVGLDKADEEQKPCFLSGSPMGVPVYKKLGFEAVGQLEIPLAEFGGEGTHVHVAMIRKPKNVV